MWVVVNWAPDLPADAPLQLRPLNPQEIDWLEKVLEDAYFDVFARLFPTDEERLRGARFPDERRPSEPELDDNTKTSD